MKRIDDACGNITHYDATRPGQGASRHDRVNHIDDAYGIVNINGNVNINDFPVHHYPPKSA